MEIPYGLKPFGGDSNIKLNLGTVIYVGTLLNCDYTAFHTFKN